jgi:peptidoglycan/LPS O-acetylase OafA/YrhL
MHQSLRRSDEVRVPSGATADANRTGYRPDIDGLRAVAIISVLLFHAFPDFMKGGFAGVDVFFVISGYLISQIIYSEVHRGRFSLLRFYGRRVRRIFPALLVVLATCLVAGWLAFFPSEYALLGKHVAGGAGFIANLVLLHDVNYFDVNPASKPLLNLWSLGVEEHIVWPLMVCLLAKTPIRFGLLALAATLLSVAVAIHDVRWLHDTQIAFFSPLARFWELMIGALAAYVSSPHRRPSAIERLFDRLNASSMLSLCGVTLIGIGFWMIGRKGGFPNQWVALPTIGTAIVILAGPDAWPNRLLLANRILVGVGLISFPLYLWHWPILSFARITNLEVPRLSLLALAFALSIATYWIVERPIRFGSPQLAGAKACALVILMIIVGAFGYSIHVADGLVSRPIAVEVDKYTQTAQDTNPPCFHAPYAYRAADGWFCTLGDRTKPPTVFAYGDSHSAVLQPALDAFGKQNGISIAYVGAAGMLPLLGTNVMRGPDELEKVSPPKLNEKVFQFVQQNGIQAVFLIAYWNYYNAANVVHWNGSPSGNPGDAASGPGPWYIQGVKDTIAAYRRIGVRVFLFEDNPRQPYAPLEALRRAPRPLSDRSINLLSITLSKHRLDQAWLDQLFRHYGDDPGVAVVNFDDLLCDSEICPYVKDAKFLYVDENHLTAFGAMQVVPVVTAAWHTALRSSTSARLP